MVRPLSTSGQLVPPVLHLAPRVTLLLTNPAANSEATQAHESSLGSVSVMGSIPVTSQHGCDSSQSECYSRMQKNESE